MDIDASLDLRRERDAIPQGASGGTVLRVAEVRSVALDEPALAGGVNATSDRFRIDSQTYAGAWIYSVDFREVSQREDGSPHSSPFQALD